MINGNCVGGLATEIPGSKGAQNRFGLGRPLYFDKAAFTMLAGKDAGSGKKGGVRFSRRTRFEVAGLGIAVSWVDRVEIPRLSADEPLTGPPYKNLNRVRADPGGAVANVRGFDFDIGRDLLALCVHQSPRVGAGTDPKGDIAFRDIPSENRRYRWEEEGHAIFFLRHSVEDDALAVVRGCFLHGFNFPGEELRGWQIVNEPVAACLLVRSQGDKRELVFPRVIFLALSDVVRAQRLKGDVFQVGMPHRVFGRETAIDTCQMALRIVKKGSPVGGDAGENWLIQRGSLGETVLYGIEIANGSNLVFVKSEVAFIELGRAENQPCPRLL